MLLFRERMWPVQPDNSSAVRVVQQLRVVGRFVAGFFAFLPRLASTVLLTRCASTRYVVPPSAAGVISRGNDVPIVKIFKDSLWTALRTVFRPKMH